MPSQAVKESPALEVGMHIETPTVEGTSGRSCKRIDDQLDLIDKVHLPRCVTRGFPRRTAGDATPLREWVQAVQLWCQTRA